jgi:hypothetical protein
LPRFSIASFLNLGARSRRPDETALPGSIAPAPDSRRHPRVDTSFSAALHVATEHTTARVRNLSLSGAMLESSLAPATGDPVHLVRGDLCAEGTIIWCSDGRCGVEFIAEIALDDWLAPPSNAEQARIDEIVAAIKAGGAAPQAAGAGAPTRARGQSPSTLADDLQMVCALLVALKADLSGSALTVTRHGSEMQYLDQAMEMLSNPELPRRSRHQLADELGAVFQLLVNMEDEFTSIRDTVARHSYKLQHLDLAMQMLTELAGDLIIGGMDPEAGSPRLDNLRVACGNALKAPAASASPSVAAPAATS